MYFLESVLGKDNSFWKYLAIFILSFLAVNTIGCIPLIIVLVIYVGKNGSMINMEEIQAMDFSSTGIPENLFLFLMLIPFVAGLFTLYLLIKFLHNRTFSETVNGRKKIRWNRIFTGFAVWFLIMFAFLSVSYIVDPNNFTFQFNITTFIPLFFISIILIPLQTTFEELLFRGYLAQGVGAWTKNRWLAVVIPAILFGLMHIMNPEVSAYGLLQAMPQYIIFGLIFGFAAVWDDGIELPMGIHAANNIFACLFVTSEHSALQTPAIFTQHSINMSLETIALIVAGTIALLFFARKYKWNLSLINKKIKPIPELNLDIQDSNQSTI
jgi:membrane protease YdiL (CAAX protease family)